MVFLTEYSIHLLFLFLFFLISTVFILVFFIKKLKEYDAINKGNKDKKDINRKKIIDNGVLCIFIVISICFLSFIIMSNQYKVNKKAYNALVYYQKQSLSANTDFRKRDQGIYERLMSPDRKESKKTILKDVSFCAEMSTVSYLTVKSALHHCFDQDDASDLYALFDYYPVSKIDANSLITKELLKNSDKLSSPECKANIATIASLVN